MPERLIDPSRKRILRSFLQGAMQPNLASASIMLGVVLAGFLSYLAIVNENLLAGEAYRYAMDKDLDTQTYATHQLLSAEPGTDPSVYVFGSSVMVRCVKDRATIADLVSARSGQSVTAYDLSTDAQTAWEFEAMVDRIPEGGFGVIVFGASYGIWTYSPKDLAELINAPKLGFPTPTIDAAAREMGVKVPLRTGIYGLDISKFFLARRRTFVENLLSGGRDYADPLDAYWMDVVNDPEFWAEEKAQLPQFVAAVDANMDMHLATMARAVETLRGKGDYEMVLFEAPIHPGWFELQDGAAFFDGINRDLRAFAEEQNIEFTSARELVDLGAEDFVDFEGHISNDAARMACTEAVADFIVEALER